MVFWRGVQKFRKLITPSSCNYEVEAGGTITFNGNASNTMVKAERLTILHNTAGLGDGVTVCTIPAGSVILSASVRIVTAWDSSVSDTLAMGWTSTAFGDLFTAQDAQATGLKSGVAGAVPTAIHNAARVIKVKVANSGDAPTAGKAEINILRTL